MSGSTSRTLIDDYFSLTLATPCIDFAIDPETGRSGEQEYHRDAAARIERAIAAVCVVLVPALPRVLAAVAGAPRLVRFDASLPLVYDFLRKDFLAGGNRPCILEFVVPAPECATLRLCFRELPDPAVVEDLHRILREFFSGLPWEGP